MSNCWSPASLHRNKNTHHYTLVVWTHCLLLKCLRRERHDFNSSVNPWSKPNNFFATLLRCFLLNVEMKIGQDQTVACAIRAPEKSPWLMQSEAEVCPQECWESQKQEKCSLQHIYPSNAVHTHEQKAPFQVGFPCLSVTSQALPGLDLWTTWRPTQKVMCAGRRGQVGPWNLPSKSSSARRY